MTTTPLRWTPELACGGPGLRIPLEAQCAHMLAEDAFPWPFWCTLSHVRSRVAVDFLSVPFLRDTIVPVTCCWCKCMDWKNDYFANTWELSSVVSTSEKHWAVGCYVSGSDVRKNSVANVRYTGWWRRAQMEGSTSGKADYPPCKVCCWKEVLWCPSLACVEWWDSGKNHSHWSLISESSSEGGAGALCLEV